MKTKIYKSLTIALLACLSQISNVQAQNESTCKIDYCRGKFQSCVDAAYVALQEGLNPDLDPCADQVRADSTCIGVNIAARDINNVEYINSDGTRYYYISCEGIVKGWWVNRKDKVDGSGRTQ